MNSYPILHLTPTPFPVPAPRDHLPSSLAQLNNNNNMSEHEEGPIAVSPAPLIVETKEEQHVVDSDKEMVRSLACLAMAGAMQPLGPP